MRMLWLALVMLVVAGCVVQQESSSSEQNSKGAGDLEGVTEPGSAIVRRIALVMGNSAYEHAPLENPVNDAEDITKKLRDSKVGFEVDLVVNANKREMIEAIRKFGKELKKGGMGLFYYAGHGMQFRGKNYLIPVEHDIRSEDEIEYYAVEAQMVLSKMEAANNQLNMMVLDACRNNPFARSFRSETRGLARMGAPTGSLVMYATEPGKEAADGSGRNGIFTEHFLKYLDQDGLELGEMVKRVTRDVYEATDGKQVPWREVSVMGDFYFVANSPVRLEIKPPGGKLKVGESLRFTVAGYNHRGEMIPIKNEWYASGGQINSEGLYQAGKISGRYYVEARVNELSERVAVEISERQKPVIKSEALAAKPEKKEEQVSFAVQTEKRFEGFRYLGRGSYSAGGKSYTVKEYEHEKTGMEFVLVPGGSFMMGSEEYSDEKPVHRVEVKEFLMGKYEVTQGVWYKIMGTKPWQGESNVKEGENYPASWVSWEAAKEFCKKTGLRLPSESEWEYGCRAGTESKYYWGEEMDGDYAWYDGNAWDIGEKYAHKVGEKKPNAYGLYDMSGNVWEWCEDSYVDNYKNHPTDGGFYYTDSSSLRVLRGGGWNNVAQCCRSANRNGDAPGDRYGYLGFRCAASP